MKLNVTAFLMKEGQTRITILAKPLPRNQVSFEIDKTPCDFYWKNQTSAPRWVDLFAGVRGVKSNSMLGKSVQGLLVLERQNRVMCFTFGHARHLISPLAIERYFGLKVALSMSDPELIRSMTRPISTKHHLDQELNLQGMLRYRN